MRGPDTPVGLCEALLLDDRHFAMEEALNPVVGEDLLTCSRLLRRERGAPTRAAAILSALLAATMRCSRASRSRVSLWELKYQGTRKPWAVPSDTWSNSGKPAMRSAY